MADAQIGSTAPQTKTWGVGAGSGVLGLGAVPALGVRVPAQAQSTVPVALWVFKGF